MLLSSVTSVRHVLLTGLLATLPLLPVSAQKRPATKAPTKTAIKPVATPETVYELYQVQIKPEYAEGQYAFQQYLKSARLPTDVQDGRIQGVVLVGFVVRPDGRLTDTYVARGLSAATNAEALRLVQAMSRWRPGRREDKPVATRYSLSVVFQKPVSETAPDLSGLSSNDRVVEEVGEPKIYTYVEQMPQYPGGMEAMQKYLRENLRYPTQARTDQVEGKVFVSFVIPADGKPTNTKILKGIGAGCDEEALRLIKNMPAWAPGKQNGRVVMVSYTVPITFRLTTSSDLMPLPGATDAPTPPAVEDKIYTYVEQMPTLGGSVSGVSQALQAALQLPAEVREGRTEGQVYVNFVVRPDGRVSDEKVVRGLSDACNAAALAAVRALPRFEPGKQNGRVVSVQLTVPVLLYGPNHVFEGGQVATQASFPGGGTALREYLTDKLKEPKVLKQENLRGAVEVRFVVQADGRIGATEIVRPLCRSCDEEALRLVRDMPRWTPARNAAGQPVSVRQQVIIPMPAVPVAPRGSTGSIRWGSSIGHTAFILVPAATSALPASL
ncbi:TonB family protein [Hymenobacter sediminicola]|uniref:TonB family protein n=1 Tax=Hymenobacter sediminicola TaxID=2761579 RepID=A0A7G7W6P0_9BACT|nr:TonB family protein [Hymenobacter sediminicola]QNH62033.1 TonB family protein [Hymenobacter sediminicola]